MQFALEFQSDHAQWRSREGCKGRATAPRRGLVGALAHFIKTFKKRVFSVEI